MIFNHVKWTPYGIFQDFKIDPLVIDPYLKTEKGVEKLINHLKQKNIPIAISTGSTTTSYGIKTQNYKKIFDQADFQIDNF